MRNPILPSLDRPVPLPDCILLDAWWADLKDEERARRETLRVLTSQSTRDDRDHQQRR